MALLVFVNLDWRYFASDESYNVTMGQYILKNHGFPKIWDGKNIITTINGNDFNDDLICINLNYGAYYITAFMQLIFGKNTYIIRLPFAFMGIFSAIIWFKYFKIVTQTGIAKIFLIIYCLSIPLIIYFRNANYFAPSLFFMGLMYLFYKKGEKELIFCPDELVDWVIVSNPLVEEKINIVNRIYLDPNKYKKIVLKTNLSNMANDIWLYSFGPYKKTKL